MKFHQPNQFTVYPGIPSKYRLVVGKGDLIFVVQIIIEVDIRTRLSLQEFEQKRK